MTKYNAHRTAYWSSIGLGGWYLLKRGQTRKMFGSLFPDHAYYLPRTRGYHADEITPEHREILLDAVDDDVLIAVWVRMQRVMDNNRESSRDPVLNKYSERMKEL